jgi:hypothetical protein
VKKLIGLILITLLMVSVSCSSEEIEGAPDDIVTVPGGPAYRANVHAAGKKNPWPDIESKTVVLTNNSCTARINYRDYIETKAGETRNNIFTVELPDNKEVTDVIVTVADVPDGMIISQGEKAGVHVRMKRVMVIEISEQVIPGEYDFEVEVNINGEDYGKVPCIIEVLE